MGAPRRREVWRETGSALLGKRTEAPRIRHNAIHHAPSRSPRAARRARGRRRRARAPGPPIGPGARTPPPPSPRAAAKPINRGPRPSAPTGTRFHVLLTVAFLSLISIRLSSSRMINTTNKTMMRIATKTPRASPRPAAPRGAAAPNSGLRPASSSRRAPSSPREEAGLGEAARRLLRAQDGADLLQVLCVGFTLGRGCRRIVGGYQRRGETTITKAASGTRVDSRVLRSLSMGNSWVRGTADSPRGAHGAWVPCSRWGEQRRDHGAIVADSRRPARARRSA